MTSRIAGRILIVDDDPMVLGMLAAMLTEAKHEVAVVNSGEAAMHWLHNPGKPWLPDIIILDIEMWEGMHGFDVCRSLKANPLWSAIPVIFVTARSDPAYEQLGFALGAVDFIHKPVSPPIVNARIRMQLALKVAADEREDRNTYLEREVDLRTQEIERRLAETRASQDVTLVALALLAETRDNETGNHLFRTQHYVRTLATHLQNHPKFSAYLSDVVIDQLFKAAPLHDIGKVGIPDRILLMPGRLDPQDFEIMKTHAEIGQKAIANAQQRVGTKIPLLDLAMEIAHGHHEKWDGSGYPQALAGEDIPLSARLMALADVYDALISRRVYKAAMPHEQAVSIMAQDPGCHFDPDLLDAFLRVQDQFRAIAERFADQGEPEIMKFNP